MQFKDNLPIYLQVYDEVLKKLLKKELVAGDKLPAIRDLAIEFKVNPNTISKSMQELENTGLFETQRGIGSFVTKDEKLIKKTLDEYVLEKVKKSVDEVYSLGVTKEELIKFLEDYNGNDTKNK